MKFLKYITLILLTFFSLTSNSQSNRTIPPEKPKLVVMIVIEQMRYDFIDRYWNRFGNRGFKRLLLEGAFCKNTYLNYMFSQSSPGFASIYTGTTPSVHGIVADKWYRSISNKKIESTHTETAITIGAEGDSGQHSPENIVSTTISDELKLTNQNSKVISIGIEPQSAVISGGHTANASYWLDNKTGQWITSNYYLDNLPNWVKNFNNKELQKLYLNRSWIPLKEIETYKNSRSDITDYEVGFGSGMNTFPYNLSKMSRINEQYPDFSIIKKVPFGNNYTKDFAIASIVNEDLGKDPHTDFLMLNFTPTKPISNNFGPFSVEVEDTYLRLDKEIEHLLDFLDTQIGKHNVLVVLTSNHGVAYAPKYLEIKKIPSGNFKSTYAIALLKSYLNAAYGEGDWVKLYFNQQIYLNRLLIEDSNLDIDKVQQKVVDFMIQFDGVLNAVSASTLEKSEFTHGMYQKMQNSFNKRRSGDVMINLKPGWLEDIITSTRSNSPYVYDSHVPLVWYGWKIKRQERSDEIEITDIATTIATFLNISKPNGSTGKAIKGLLK